MSEQQRSHFWIGRETYQKEQHFSGLIGGIHIRVCESICRRLGRPGDPPYTFIDLHGGPGNLRDDDGNEFTGSPLIALDALARSGIPYETVHFEKDPTVAAELRAAIDQAVYPCSTVTNMPHEEGMRQWLENVDPHPYRYGIVYSDPIGDPIPVDTFNAVGAKFPRVDLLAYVAANNQYKRNPKPGRTLAGDVAAVQKKTVLIREPQGGEQYTFLMFSDWDMPEWTKAGFFRIGETGRGRQILNTLNNTHRHSCMPRRTPHCGRMMTNRS